MLNNTFKYIVSLNIILAILSSCNREVIQESVFPCEMIPMTVIPSMESSKTSLIKEGGEYVPHWTAGDALAMSYAKCGSSSLLDQGKEFTATISQSGTSAVFSGNISTPETSGDYDFYAVFPFRNVKHSATCEGIQTLLPATQIFPAGDIDPQADILVSKKITMNITPSVSSLDDVAMQFGRPVSFAHIKVKSANEKYAGQKVESVSISNDSCPFAGLLSINALNLCESPVTPEGSSNTVIGIPAEEMKVSELDAILVLAPCTLGNGSKLKISIRMPECTIYKEITIETPSEFKSNDLKELSVNIDDNWSETTQIFSGGNGSSENPYQIATAADLVQLSNLTNDTGASKYLDKYYVQTADIDLGGRQWIPIASSNTFSGFYDGQSHCISGLVLDAVGGYPGFVSHADGATFKDISFGTSDGKSADGTSRITLGTLSSSDWTFIGLFADIKDTKLSGIANYVPFTVHNTANAKISIGAISGGFTGASVADGCVNYAAITDDNGDTAYLQNILGGCFGSVYASGAATASIISCKNFGEVKAGTGSCQYVGGILGKVESSESTAGRLSMKDCENYANVKNVSSNNYSKKYVHIGGIIGASDNATVSGCVNNADLSGSTAVWHQTFGGIIGYPQRTTVTECINNGAMSTDASTNLVAISEGGIAGWTQNTNTISRCVNNGAIYARRNQVVRCGGIAGTISNTEVLGCTNTGKVKVDQTNTGTGSWITVAGIVGFVDTKGSSNNVSDNINKGDVESKSSITSATATVLAGVGGIIGVILPAGTYSNNVNTGVSISGSNTGTSPCYVGGVFGLDYTVAVNEMTGNVCKEAAVSASGSAAAAGGFIGASTISSCITRNKSLATEVSCTTGKGAGAVVGFCENSTIDFTTVSGSVNNTELTQANYLNYAYGTNTGTVSNTLFSSVEEYSFSGGSGTIADPYLIGTADDLMKLAELTNGASADNFASMYYKQTADIDLDGQTWKPICAAAAFTGSYDGDGHKIYNMCYQATSGYPSFVSSAKNATLKNITFGSRDGKSYDGKSAITLGEANSTGWTFMGLVASAEDCNVSGIVNFIPFTVLNTANVKIAVSAIVSGVVGATTVSGCVNNAVITDNNNDSEYRQNILGGCFGSVYSSGSKGATISRCVNNGELLATTASCLTLGGILGKVETSEATIGKVSLSDCENYANVKNTASGSYSKAYIHIGGIVGSTINATLKSCINHADLSGSTAPLHQTFGGIVGYPQASTISSCTNKGSISSNTTGNAQTVSIGGIAGWTQNTNTIENCVNEGTVSGRRNQVVRCGGIAGTISNTDVKSCTNSGAINLDQSGTATASWQAAGGIVGFVDTKASTNSIVSCTNKAKVDLKASVTSTSASVLVSAGGIAGIILPTGTYSNNINSGATISASNSGTSPCYAGGIFGLDYTVAVTEMSGNICENSSVSASGTTSAAGGVLGASVISTVISGNKSFNTSVACSEGYGAGAVVGYNTKTIDKTAISGTVNSNVLTAGNFESYAYGTNTGTITNTTFAEAVEYSFSGGKGTLAEPFVIGNATDLKKLSELSNNENATNYSSKHYILGADINMGGTDFSPISNTPLASFSGSFEGGGHKITGLDAKGGLIGVINGADISGIEFKDIRISAESEAGAVCNMLLKGSISLCKVSGDSRIASTAGNVGGIAGLIDAQGDVIIDQCSVLAPVSGHYNIGGIAGCSTSSTASAIAITNCVYAGSALTATGSSEGSSNEGGIVGLMANKSGVARQDILNCSSILPKITYPESVESPCAGGILGKMSGDAGISSVQGCWSSFQLCYLWKDNYNMTKAVDNNDKAEKITYGAIVGDCPSNLKIASCYWYDSTKMGPSTLTNTENCAYVGRMETLKSKMNQFVSSYSGQYQLKTWNFDSRRYPVPANLSTDNPGYNQTRISVIGASVSTFRSWITIGNAYYFYDGRDGFDVSYNDTYWYRLAHDFLPNARIEKNIAWSGSCMASCDSQSTKPGFVTRYERYGIGSPDIIILAGPANEANRNKNGQVVDATEGFAYNQEVSDAALEKLYSASIDELDTRYFLDATVKLVRTLHETYPDVILVLEIYDYYLTAQMAHGIAKIANHYDYVTLVDFYADGYDNIPKYSGHPLSSGHLKMATKIYDAIRNKL